MRSTSHLSRNVTLRLHRHDVSLWPKSFRLVSKVFGRVRRPNYYLAFRVENPIHLSWPLMHAMVHCRAWKWYFSVTRVKCKDFNNVSTIFLLLWTHTHYDIWTNIVIRTVVVDRRLTNISVVCRANYICVCLWNARMLLLRAHPFQNATISKYKIKKLNSMFADFMYLKFPTRNLSAWRHLVKSYAKVLFLL